MTDKIIESMLTEGFKLFARQTVSEPEQEHEILEFKSRRILVYKDGEVVLIQDQGSSFALCKTTIDEYKGFTKWFKMIKKKPK